MSTNFANPVIAAHLRLLRWTLPLASVGMQPITPHDSMRETARAWIERQLEASGWNASPEAKDAITAKLIEEFYGGEL